MNRNDLVESAGEDKGERGGKLGIRPARMPNSPNSKPEAGPAGRTLTVTTQVLTAAHGLPRHAYLLRRPSSRGSCQDLTKKFGKSCSDTYYPCSPLFIPAMNTSLTLAIGLQARGSNVVKTDVQCSLATAHRSRELSRRTDSVLLLDYSIRVALRAVSSYVFVSFP